MDISSIHSLWMWFLLLLPQLMQAATSVPATDDALIHTAFYRAKTYCSDMILTDRRGVIESPQYPNMYPSHVSCIWRIIADMGEVVTIMFDDMDIEESGICDQPPCCVFNWVKFGPSLNGTEVQYCGQNIMIPSYVSSTPKMWIKFHISKMKLGGRGFKLSYSIGPRMGFACKTNEFKCSNFECVSQSLRCNGFPDCIDGSDEKLCSGKCCDNSFVCYHPHQLCDGIFECSDYSDEMGCGRCSVNETRCSAQSDQCYNPHTQRCNRVTDCTNGEDEKDCLSACLHKIMCTSGVGCYTPDERCDGIAQCSDSSDEKKCLPDLCNYEHGGFLCANSRCIREIWKCDGTDDCGDGTDETNCLRNSVLTAAVMGSLICALLLVIAISCTCRLYSFRESQLTSRETVLSRLSQDYIFREPPPSYAASVGDHCRNLCVENIHYNACPRRGRRRPRRARRMHESRRPSIATVENPGSNNARLPFNIVLSMPSSVENLPNPVVSRQLESQDHPNSVQPSRDNFSDTCSDVKLNSGSKDDNAESSFSESSNSYKIENAEDVSPVPVSYSCSTVNNALDNLSFQSELAEDAVDKEESVDNQNVESHGDIDLQPLIT